LIRNDTIHRYSDLIIQRILPTVMIVISIRVKIRNHRIREFKPRCLDVFEQLSKNYFVVLVDIRFLLLIQCFAFLVLVEYHNIHLSTTYSNLTHIINPKNQNMFTLIDLHWLTSKTRCSSWWNNPYCCWGMIPSSLLFIADSSLGRAFLGGIFYQVKMDFKIRIENVVNS